LKEQLEKLELIASPFDKPDPFLDGLMKLSPEDADVRGVPAKYNNNKRKANPIKFSYFRKHSRP
jgi:hypothetical protein